MEKRISVNPSMIKIIVDLKDKKFIIKLTNLIKQTALQIVIVRYLLSSIIRIIP